jgi:hypothetical protein
MVNDDGPVGLDGIRVPVDHERAVADAGSSSARRSPSASGPSACSMRPCGSGIAPVPRTRAAGSSRSACACNPVSARRSSRSTSRVDDRARLPAHEHHRDRRDHARRPPARRPPRPQPGAPGRAGASSPIRRGRSSPRSPTICCAGPACSGSPPDFRTARSLRRRLLLLAVPGRLTCSARCWTLHLPAGKLWQTAFLEHPPASARCLQPADRSLERSDTRRARRPAHDARARTQLRACGRPG